MLQGSTSASAELAPPDVIRLRLPAGTVPSPPRGGICALVPQDLSQTEADIEFHRAFVKAIQRWLVAKWGFGHPLWGSRERMQARREFLAGRDRRAI